MLHNFLKRAKKEMLLLQIDCMHELSRCKGLLRGTYTATAVSSTVLGCAVVAYADAGEATLQGFSSNVVKIISELWSSAFSIITVLAALLLVIAFGVRMTANQQKAAQATSWITRIILCYVAINCIGILFKVIDSTTAGMGYDVPGGGS